MKWFARLLLIAMLAMLGSCSERGSNDWGFMQFSEVRGYYMNWDEQFAMDSILHADRTLNGTRLPVEGVVLSPEQVEALKAALTGTHPVVESADCIYPHHAFVFFSASGEIVGAINLCFLCNNDDGSPRGYAENWDMGALSGLLTELGLPITNPQWQ